MFPRKAAVLAVTLTLALPWCAAAARPAFSLPARGEASASLEQLRAGFWSWLRSVWTKEGCSLDPGGAKEGCTIDPGGAKAGCTIDPSGQPICGPKSAGGPKVGCGLDPGGNPVCGPTSAMSNTDVGCSIDPGGSPCGGRQ